MIYSDMKNKIKQLVKKAFQSNSFDEISIGKVSKSEDSEIQKILGESLLGCERYIDVYSVRHCIGNHGNIKQEAKRGQVAVSLDDFELIPTIIKSPDKVEYAGKNRLKQDLIKYTKRIDNLFVVVEAVRVKKKGNRLYFQTMYKRK